MPVFSITRREPVFSGRQRAWMRNSSGSSANAQWITAVAASVIRLRFQYAAPRA